MVEQAEPYCGGEEGEEMKVEEEEKQEQSQLQHQSYKLTTDVLLKSNIETAKTFFRSQRKQALQKLKDAEDISCCFLLNSIKHLSCYEDVKKIMSPYVNGRAKETLGDFETTDNLIPTEVLERVRHVVITTTFLNKIDSFYSSSVQVGENARSLDIEKAEELQKKQISNNLLFSKLDSSSTFYGIPSSGAGRLDRADALAYMKQLRSMAKTHTDHLEVLSIQLSALTELNLQRSNLFCLI